MTSQRSLGTTSYKVVTSLPRSHQSTPHVSFSRLQSRSEMAVLTYMSLHLFWLLLSKWVGTHLYAWCPYHWHPVKKKFTRTPSARHLFYIFQYGRDTKRWGPNAHTQCGRQSQESGIPVEKETWVGADRGFCPGSLSLCCYAVGWVDLSHWAVIQGH